MEEWPLFVCTLPSEWTTFSVNITQTCHTFVKLGKLGKISGDLFLQQWDLQASHPYIT